VLSAEDDIAVIASVGTLHEALAVVRLHRPDVALVDIAVLGDRGMGGLSELRAARSRMALLVIGVADDPALDREAVRQGAVGRLLKDAPEGELVDAVRAAARRPTRLRIVPPDD
jgi:DNA-binding NarL/FixJ family response regulator